MTITEIQAFLSIIKYGTISEAAKQLYVSQPALSRRIQTLEKELGYELFLREKGIRSVSLTEEGAAFLSVSEKLLRLYREAQAISDLKRKPVFHLASIGSISTYLLPHVFRQMTAADSPCHLDFHNCHSYEAYSFVESGMVDLALISDDMYHRTVVTRPLFREPFVLVTGADWTGRVDDVTGSPHPDAPPANASASVRLSPSPQPIHPSSLDPGCEIRLPWNPEFDAWHEKWFDATIYPRVQLDQMSLLEEFLTGDAWAVVPLIVARCLNRQPVSNTRLAACDFTGTPIEVSPSCSIHSLSDGPEDEIIYYLTRSGQTSALCDYFLDLLRQELQLFSEVQLLL